MNVLIRPADTGAILLGAPPAAPAGAGVVGLQGADLFVDPTAPDDPSHLVVHDAAEAAVTVALLYGDDAAAAVARIADGGHGSSPEFDGATAVAVAVRTLGLLRWLESYSPDLLSASLLDLEFGTAAAAAADVLAEVEAEEGERRLLRRAGLTASLAAQLRAPAHPRAPAGLADLVGAAQSAVGAVLPVDSRHHDALRNEEEEAATASALRHFGIGPQPEWDLLTRQPGVGDRTVPGAVHAGPPGDRMATRRTSVDWFQVPHGLLDTREGTVEWSLSGGDPPLVEVRVRAWPDVTRSDHLGFRLYGGDLGVPLAVGRLRPADDGREYAGSAPVIGTVADPLVLDVHDLHDTRPPRLGLDRTTAQAARWAARGITALRLGGDTADGAARGALTQASGRYRQLVADTRDLRDRGTAQEQQQLAARRQARCIALRRAVLRRQGNVRDERALSASAIRLAQGVLPADTEPPDLDGPGWRPLAVENAVAAHPAWELR